MRKPSLTRRVIEGLIILANNPCAAEHITEIKRFNIKPDELEKARAAYEWIEHIREYRDNR